MKNTRLPAMKSYIAQHNNLIYAAYSMSNIEMKIYIYALSCVLKDDTHFGDIEIPIQMLTNCTGNISGEVYKDIYEATSKLLTRILVTIKPGEENLAHPSFKKYGIFSTCEYDRTLRRIRVKFNADMAPFLLSLKRDFTTATINELLKLSSFYSFRIYLLLMNACTKSSNHRRNRKLFIELEALKDILSCGKGYDRLDNFERRILKPAKKEVASTDMAFTYKKVRVQSRSITHIEFKVLGDPIPIDMQIPFPTETHKEEKPKKSKQPVDKTEKLLRNLLSQNEYKKVKESMDAESIAEAIGAYVSDRENGQPKPIHDYLLVL